MTATVKGNALAKLWAASSGSGGVPVTNEEEVNRRITELVTKNREKLVVLRTLIQLLKENRRATPGQSDSAGSKALLDAFVNSTTVGKWWLEYSSEVKHRLTDPWWTGPNSYQNLTEIEAALDSLLAEPEPTTPTTGGPAKTGGI